MLHPKLRRPVVGLAVGILAGTALTVSPASPAAGAANSVAPTALAATLDARFGGLGAGSYIDSAGKVVVTVTDAATAKAVTAAGGVARMVARSGSVLAATDNTLKATLKTPGTAFAVDPVGNQVLVTADSTVTGAELAEVRATVAKLGSAARLEITPGTLRPLISGGDAIYGGPYRCSLGFNVRDSAGTNYFITAGHCTNAASTWSTRTASLGSRTATSFPGNDYGVVRYTNTTIAKSGAVGSQDIASSRNARVGERVSRRGSTTGIHSGTVTALNATANYREGSVTGLIRTTVCAEGGDSGGSLYTGSVALGITSGGSGNCSLGGVTYFQPVTEVLDRFGLSVF